MQSTGRQVPKDPCAVTRADAAAAIQELEQEFELRRQRIEEDFAARRRAIVTGPTQAAPI